MTGISRHTGARITRADHLAQSAGVILSTPVGSCVLARDFGSDLPRLIDAPINGETVIDLYAATAEALDKWEPRIKLRRVAVDHAEQGKVVISLEAEIANSTLTTPIEVTL